MMAKYKMIIYATVSFHNTLEVEADTLGQAYDEAAIFYQNADVCKDWVCDEMDCDIEELNDD
jgi:hypothetical protein